MVEMQAGAQRRRERRHATRMNRAGMTVVGKRMGEMPSVVAARANGEGRLSRCVLPCEQICSKITPKCHGYKRARQPCARIAAVFAIRPGAEL